MPILHTAKKFCTLGRLAQVGNVVKALKKSETTAIADAAKVTQHEHMCVSLCLQPQLTTNAKNTSSQDLIQKWRELQPPEKAKSSSSPGQVKSPSASEPAKSVAAPVQAEKDSAPATAGVYLVKSLEASRAQFRELLRKKLAEGVSCSMHWLVPLRVALVSFYL